jgi:lysozyme
VTKKGVDVSAYQGTINWAEAKAGGVEFAEIKATEGVGFVDPQFFINWRNARSAGLPCIAYHYWHAALTAQAQATWFLAVVKQAVPAFRPGVDGTMCDGEDTAASGNVEPAIDAFMEAVAAGLKEPDDDDYLYSGLWFMQPHGLTGSSDVASKYPLILAAYQADAPAAPSGWSRVAIWQSSDSGKVSGIAGGVDTDEMLVDPASATTAPQEEEMGYIMTAPNLPAQIVDGPSVTGIPDGSDETPYTSKGWQVMAVDVALYESIVQNSFQALMAKLIAAIPAVSSAPPVLSAAQQAQASADLTKLIGDI